MAQLADHRDLLDAYQPGDLAASERIVRAYQNEMLRSAFLLSGTADDAVRLARNAFLGLFRELMRGGLREEDPRLALLRHLGHRYLAGEPGDDGDDGAGTPAGLLGSVSFAGAPQRYRVEDDRSRVLTALELFDRPTRLGLVLREFNALEEEPVCRILDETPFVLRERLHPARTRVRDAAGAGEDQSVRELLITTATSAPRPNLWPEVAGPLEDLHAEEEERRQRYTYAAAVLVACLLLLAVLWLLDLFPFGGGEDSDTAAVPTPGPTATATATPEPTITPTPIPDLSSFDIPQGDVPARILMQLFGGTGGEEVAEVGYYDLAAGTFTPHDFGWYARPSPDGRLLVGILIPELDPEISTPTLFASDSATGERLWTRELPDGIYSYVVTSDRVYAAASIISETEEPAGLMAFDLATGQPAGEWPELITDVRTGAITSVLVSLHASPDGERLFVALEEIGSGPAMANARTLASYHLLEMTFESSSAQTDSTSVRQFPSEFSFFDAQVTPDGAYLYDVGDDIVRFRSARLNQDLDLVLPFSGRASSGQPGDLRWTTSNDGRYLYILALERGRAAIVDLLARQTARSFPLDLSIMGASMESSEPAASLLGPGLGAGIALSPDGWLLYVVGAAGEVEGVGQTAIWIVDVTTWSVVNGGNVPGQVLQIAYLNGALVAFAARDEANVDGGFLSRTLFLDPGTLAVLEERSNLGLPEWARGFLAVSLPEVYRRYYGRAPAVDGAVHSDVETVSTLPWVEVGTSPEAVPAGGAIDIEIQVRHPSTGERLTAQRPDVRFDPDANVAVRLFHDDGEAEDVILVASRVETGRYRANASFTEIGFWSAEAAFTNADGSSWSVSLPQVFEVVPSLEASDGKRYVLRVRSDPAEPEVNEEARIEAVFVDIEDGEPLPEGVELLDGMPDGVSVSFSSSGSGEVSLRLALNERGVFEGETVFWAAGEWEARAILRYDDPRQIAIGAGTITVVPG